jgi:hypothetical protein
LVRNEDHIGLARAIFPFLYQNSPNFVVGVKDLEGK